MSNYEHKYQVYPQGDLVDELNKYAELTLAIASGYDDVAVETASKSN